MITQIPNCMNGARTLLSTTIKKYKREQLASLSRLAYPCNQANEKKKKKMLCPCVVVCYDMSVGCGVFWSGCVLWYVMIWYMICPCDVVCYDMAVCYDVSVWCGVLWYVHVLWSVRVLWCIMICPCVVMCYDMSVYCSVLWSARVLWVCYVMSMYM